LPLQQCCTSAAGGFGNQNWSSLPVALLTLTCSVSTAQCAACLLFFTGNCIREIPYSLTQLVHLEDLNVSGNAITSLPEGIGALTALKKLSLHGNQLTALPQQARADVLVRAASVWDGNSSARASVVIRFLQEGSCCTTACSLPCCISECVGNLTCWILECCLGQDHCCISHMPCYAPAAASRQPQGVHVVCMALQQAPSC